MARASHVETLCAMLVLVYYLLAISMVSGSMISLHATPTTITPLMTPSLTVSCYINDTAGAGGNSGGLVGRRDLTGGVTRTPDDVSFVISIILQRSNGQQVASITEHTTAQLLSQDPQAVVSGSLVENGGARGYLSVTWDNPEESVTGDFKCEINGLQQSGHTVMFTDSVSVSSSNPTIEDIIQRINDNKRESDSNKANMLKQMEEMKIQHVKEKDALKIEIQNITSQLSKVTTTVAFSAVKGNGNPKSAYYQSVASGTTLVFNKALTNIGGAYDINTGIFTCPQAGPYYIRYDMQGVYGSQSSTSLVLNGDVVTWSWSKDDDDSGYLGAGLVLELKQGDKLHMITERASQFYWYVNSGYSSFFSGYLLK